MLRIDKVVMKHIFFKENKLILSLPLAKHTCGGGGGGGVDGVDGGWC